MNTKQKQTHRYKEQTRGYQWRVRRDLGQDGGLGLRYTNARRRKNKKQTAPCTIDLDFTWQKPPKCPVIRDTANIILNHKQITSNSQRVDSLLLHLGQISWETIRMHVAPYPHIPGETLI